jgi:DnaA family protein
MRQLPLAIAPRPEPTLDNFIPGENAELLARLRELAAGRLRETVIYLWGAPASGRSHLLAACAAAGANVADDVERLDAPGQVELFHRINRARESGGTVVAAGNAPPAALALREDLRTRLGGGLVYQVQPLADEEKARCLRAEAERRGLRLGDEVLDYLLSRVRRDMRSLAAVLDRLDALSLELKRPITVPLAREALKAPGE